MSCVCVCIYQKEVIIQDEGVILWDIHSLKGHLEAYSSLPQYGIITQKPNNSRMQLW